MQNHNNPRGAKELHGKPPVTFVNICRVRNICLDIPRAGQGGRGSARPGGGAGQGMAGRGQTVAVRCPQETIAHIALQCTEDKRLLGNMNNRNLPNPKPGDTTVGSGWGGAGRVGADRVAGGFVRPGGTGLSCPPGNRRQTVLNDSSEKRTNEILCAGTKRPFDDRFIRGLSAGREALFVPGC